MAVIITEERVARKPSPHDFLNQAFIAAIATRNEEKKAREALRRTSLYQIANLKKEMAALEARINAIATLAGVRQ